MNTRELKHHILRLTKCSSSNCKKHFYHTSSLTEGLFICAGIWDVDELSTQLGGPECSFLVISLGSSARECSISSDCIYLYFQQLYCIAFCTLQLLLCDPFINIIVKAN
ncbi:hypothetical protein OWV82_025048 [Melia azedarach]|uniref:Uncharacterized protein n=1 Tax=Melia azedarach TaxID=155640 RepID=A0ACC1WU93_MELAZ|nr:hypothetical protein OWV82_025048 [Melia azedarach]